LSTDGTEGALPSDEGVESLTAGSPVATADGSDPLAELDEGGVLGEEEEEETVEKGRMLEGSTPLAELDEGGVLGAEGEE